MHKIRFEYTKAQFKCYITSFSLSTLLIWELLKQLSVAIFVVICKKKKIKLVFTYNNLEAIQYTWKLQKDYYLCK